MRTYLLLTFILLYYSVYSQTKPNPNSTKNSPTKETNIEQHLKVYRNSLNCGDFQSAIYAMNYIVVHFEKTGQYQDTLAILYYNTNQLNPALFWAEKVLKNNPQNLTMLEIAAESYSANNDLIKSLDNFQKIYDINKSTYILFKIAELQLKVKRIYECLNSTIIAESKTDVKDLFYVYRVGNNELKTPIMSAFYNIRGMALYELNKKTEALNAFELALKVDPNNLLVLDNYKILKQEIDDLNKPKENTISTEPVKDEAKPIEPTEKDKKKKK